MKEEKLKEFGRNIDRILRGEGLSRKETYNMFREVLLDEQTPLHQGALLGALTAKSPTFEEIAGAWEAIYELDTVKINLETLPIVDNCGTGMDIIKTFNISTTSAIIAAAGGIYMARHGARAISSRCGTVDVTEALGVDVECDAELVKRSIINSGIGLFNGMSSNVHPQALFRILSQIRFGSILNIAGSLANPALPKYGIRGVYSENIVKLIAEVMREIGFRKALIFYGFNSDKTRGMDEISPLGETVISEVKDGEIFTYSVFPKDFGIQHKLKEEELLASESPEIEATKIIKILNGKDKGARYLSACLNAAPIFYISGKTKTLKGGFEMAIEIIESKKAIAKLFEWVREQNKKPQKGEEKLKKLIYLSKKAE